MIDEFQSDENYEFGRVSAILDKGAYFKGKLTFEGTVKIGGEFEGEIFSHETLVVDSGAKVQAEIEAMVVVISGEVKGNIYAKERVIMHPPAVFKGTITSPSLRIDEGVIFEGASYVPNKTSANENPVG